MLRSPHKRTLMSAPYCASVKPDWGSEHLTTQSHQMATQSSETALWKAARHIEKERPSSSYSPGVLMVRSSQNLVLNMWNIWLWSQDDFICPENCNALFWVLCIPPSTNEKAALKEQWSMSMKTHPDAAVIILGDFTHCNLWKKMTKLHQFVTFPTRVNKTLDHCYSNIRNAFSAEPKPQKQTTQSLNTWQSSSVQSTKKGSRQNQPQWEPLINQKPWFMV